MLLGAFALGLAGSIGPCMVPRYVALLGMLTDERPHRAVVKVAFFIAGLTASYALLVTIASVLGFLNAYSREIYALFALLCFTYGIVQIVRTQRHVCSRLPSRHVGNSAAFVGGAGLGLVISPCCAPVLAAFALSALPGSDPHTLWAVFFAFCFGHFLPLIVAALGVKTLARAATDTPIVNAGRVVSGGLVLSLGAYYGLLA